MPTAWWKWVGVGALGFALSGCGASGSGTVRDGGSTQISVRVALSTHQIGVPSWMTGAGVTKESLGSATGYMLDAMHNAVIWEQGSWQFRVVGPFVAAGNIEVGQLQDAFRNAVLPGTGVIALTETHSLWDVAVSWQTGLHQTIRTARFAIAGSNTDAIRAVVGQMMSRRDLRPGPWACRATLRAVDNATAIADSIQCHPIEP